jgi:DNA mismatch endonuclease (patch repair protein)
MGLSRSEQMARIRGHDTAPEMRLRQALWRAGLRFRLKESGLTIRPDLVFGTAAKIAVFIDGCFWHGCPDHYTPPRSAIEFWSKKLEENVERDRRQTLELEAAGWRVLRFWECEVIESIDRCVLRVQRALQGSRFGRGRAWRVIRIEWLDAARNLERRWLQDLRDPTKLLSQERRRLTAKARPPKVRAAKAVPVRARALRKHGSGRR